MVELGWSWISWLLLGLHLGLKLASLLPRAWMGVISARSLSILSLGCLAGPWEVRTSLNFSRVVPRAWMSMDSSAEKAVAGPWTSGARVEFTGE